MHHATVSPNGYPHLGLGWVWETPPGTGRAAAAAVRAFEEARGGRCTVRGFHRLDGPVAGELAAVYLALRTAWPAVGADWFAVADLDDDTLGRAWPYPVQWPEAHRHLRRRQDSADRARLAVTAVRGGRELRAAVRGGQVVDPTRTGRLELGRWVADETQRRSLAAHWNRSDAAHRRWTTTPRSAVAAVSVQAAVLIHEFGHLAEAELRAVGDHAVEDVYGALSAAILGPGTRQRLVDYPKVDFPTEETAAEPDAVTAAAIAGVLGAYAATDRGELFAEAFLHAHVAADAALRARLAPFRRRLRHHLTAGLRNA